MFFKKSKPEKKIEPVELIEVTCTDCNGRGLKDENTLCQTCEGHGKVEEK